MRGLIRVIGDSAASNYIRRALAGAGFAVDSLPAALAIGCDWEDLAMLRTLDTALGLPWMLVEDCGGGQFALGPIFSANRAGCFQCYVARRGSNGGSSCRPPREIPPRVVWRLAGEVDSFLAGRSPLLDGQLLIDGEFEPVLQAFLPVPGCIGCRDRPVCPRPLSAEALIGDRLGLVSRIVSLDAPWGIAACRAFGCGTDVLHRRVAINHGMAADLTLSAARARAVAESLERYCASFYPEDLPLIPVSEVVHSLSQRGLVFLPGDKCDDRLRLRWTYGQLLLDGKQTRVPATRVYLPYYRSSEEDELDIQSSTGLAAGRSLDEAIEHGLGEVIERDAFMRAWRYRLPVARVDPLPVSIPGLHLASVPCIHGLSVVVAFIENEALPLSSVGIAARLSIAEASKSATLEAVATYIWLEEWLARAPALPPFPPRTLEDHARVHAVRPDLRAARTRWLEAQLRAGLSELPKIGWREIATRFPGACMVDLTTPEVRAAGVYVVRVLVPGLVPLDHDALHPRLPGGDTTPHPIP